MEKHKPRLSKAFAKFTSLLSISQALAIFNWIKTQIARPSISKLTNSIKQTQLVSVVIPIYDRTDVLREAINSVLDQSYENFEIILVLDGSPIETVRVAKEYLEHPRIRIYAFSESSGTAVKPRNLGISLARGKYIAFLDSDDLMSRNRLEISVGLLEQGFDLVYGSWRAIVDGTRSISGLKDGQIVHSPQCDFEMLLETSVPCQSTVTVRKSIFDRIGLLKTRMRYREDHELWIRAAFFGSKFKVVNAELCKLRLHSGNNELNFASEDAFWKSEALREYKFKGQTIEDFISATAYSQVLS